MVTFVPCGAQLCTFAGGYPDEELVWVGDGRFASTERPMSIAAVRDSSGAIVGLSLTNDGRQRVIPRVGPPRWDGRSDRLLRDHEPLG